MLDIEDRLRSSANSWQRAVDHGAKPVAEPLVVRTTQRSRARMLAPAFSVLAVLVIAAGLFVAGRPEDNKGPAASAPSGPTRPATYSGVTFHLPLQWMTVPTRSLELEWYLTNGKSVVRLYPKHVYYFPRAALNCTESDRALCTALAIVRSRLVISNMHARDAYVFIYQTSGDTAHETWTRKIAGLPARQENLRSSSCVDAASETGVVIRTGQRSELALHACFGPGSATEQRQFAQVLRTATHN